MEELEGIVEDLESGDLSLENSLKSFEKGIKLARQCQEQLSKAELQVQKLIEENGELKTLHQCNKSPSVQFLMLKKIYR